jgi:hypothetical protein
MRLLEELLRLWPPKRSYSSDQSINLAEHMSGVQVPGVIHDLQAGSGG